MAALSSFKQIDELVADFVTGCVLQQYKLTRVFRQWLAAMANAPRYTHPLLVMSKAKFFH